MSKVESIPVCSNLKLDWLRDFVYKAIIPGESRDLADDRFDISIYEELHRQGLTHAITPKSYGGVEAQMIDLIWMHRELAYGSASASATLLASLLGYSAVILYGSPELQKRLCIEFPQKFGLWSFAMSEAEAGSDLTETKTYAVEVDGGYEITGMKNFITNASHSTYLIVFAMLKDAHGKDLGVTAFYLDGDAKGLTRGPTYDKFAWRKANTGTLIFNRVFVPTTQRLARVGDGLSILGRCLNRSKVLMGATAVGLANRAFDLAVERVSATTRFKKVLVEQPAVRHRLAQMSTQIEAAWLLICSAGAAWETLPSSTRESSMAKLFAGSVAVSVASDALELFGSRGLFNEFEVSRLYRDAKVLEIIEGPTFIQELLISREILSPERPAKSELKLELVHPPKNAA